MKHLGTKRIETERLLLRPFCVEDAQAMYQNWASDPEVTRYLTWAPHANAQETKALLSDWVAEYQKKDFYNWAMVDKRTEEVIGNVSVVKVQEEINEASLGYCMSRAYWGRGLMPEAVSAVMDYLFDEVGAHRIAARHDSRNPKSGRVMEKVGMKKEGVLRQAGKSTTGICDLVCYAMILSDRK